ncbi:MAG: type III secretion system export apparatus subunit SctT [Deltaproteobacteria bacterium]|nr:type III secretion system export apparatus subunit SctT [Deltaproteobacteria bacterium]
MIIQVSNLTKSLAILGISSARLITCFNIVPFIGGKIIPHYVRNAIVMSIVLTTVYPFVSITAPDKLTILQGLILLGKEIFVGLIMGFVVGILFWSIEITGFLIDNQRGAGMASVFDPLYGHSTSPMGVLFLQLLTVLFFASGGFLVFLEGIFASYQFWPVFEYVPKIEGKLFIFFLNQADLLMKTGFLLAAPFLITIFLVDLSLGLINRFVPQLNVFFLSMPIKSGISSFLLVAYIAVIAYYYRPHFAGIDEIIKELSGVIK